MIDAHCHRHFSKQVDEANPSIQDFLGEQIEGAILADYGGPTRKLMLDFAQYKNIWCTIGTHPWNQDETIEDWYSQMNTSFIQTHSVVGIGEFGLDFFRAQDSVARVIQEENCRSHFAIAHEFKLPVVLHVVRAHAEMLKILKEEKFLHGGIVHAFNASYEIAKEYLDLGFLLSIGPVIQKKPIKLLDVIKKVGLGQLVIESDAEDWQRESLINVGQSIADLLQFDMEHIQMETNKNIQYIFRIIT